VPAHEFLFALELSDCERFDAMMAEVAVSVFKLAGLSPVDAASTLADLRAALGDAERAGASRCDVRFRAHEGEFLVAVSANGHEWHTTRRLPS
jgi:hypothetical protein